MTEDTADAILDESRFRHMMDRLGHAQIGAALYTEETMIHPIMRDALQTVQPPKLCLSCGKLAKSIAYLSVETQHGDADRERFQCQTCGHEWIENC